MNNKPKLPTKSTKRDLVYYEKMLGFSRELLEGKTVLDLGSGSSDLEENLQQQGVNPEVVINLDITDNVQNVGVQADMTEKRLPFEDDSFDVLLSLWSFYQIYSKDRLHLLEEMMRISKTIHIGPVYQDDIDMMKEACDRMNYEIILCQPQKFSIYSYLSNIVGIKHVPGIERVAKCLSRYQEEARYIVSNEQDYHKYKQMDASNRVIETTQEALDMALNNKFFFFAKQGDARLCVLQKKDL